MGSITKKFICLAIISLILSCYFAIAQSSTSDLYIPPRQDFRIAVISDLNSQYGSTEYEPEVDKAISLIPQWQPDLVLCGGDMIAGQKASLTQPQIEAMWQAFDRHVAQPLRRYNVPFGFTIGNHDGSGAIKENTLIFAGERDLARTYWHKPQHELGLNFVDRANFPFFYSFQQNDIFFLVWDASTHNISDTQITWLEEQFQTPAARQAKTKIVIGHLPLYPVAKTKNKPGEYLKNAEQLRSLLEKNGVKIYISGHHHAYYPGKKGQLELLNSGALGQGSRRIIDSNLLPQQTITIVDLNLETLAHKVTYTTYNVTTWNLILPHQLPKSITGENGTIFRYDL